MANEEDENRYAILLEQSELSGSIDSVDTEMERRDHPRFKIEDTDLLIDVKLQVKATNISRSGVAFHSNLRFHPGQRFSVNVGTVFSITAEVVDCEMHETDRDLLETRYLVRSKFVEEELDLPNLLAIIGQ